MDTTIYITFLADLQHRTHLKPEILFHEVGTFFFLLLYRAVQPDWEYTMWKKDCCATHSGTHILREINFGHFEAPKTALWTI